MAELKRMVCSYCGRSFDEESVAASQGNGVLVCGHCGSVFTVAHSEDEEVLRSLHNAREKLDLCDFDGALTLYGKVAELDPKEPEAYFGMALAKFKVQYLKDEVNNRLQPICHENSEKSFLLDSDYRKAMALSTEAFGNDKQAQAYFKKAEEIDDIHKKFFELEKSGLDYDCFICVKVREGNSGNDGEHGEKKYTEDSKDATYIYDRLKNKGYKPFYSEYEIRNKQGTDYEAHILYALYKSECMLVICRNEEYLQTKWVKNEYTRFLRLVNDQEKESDSITIVFNGKPVEKLPGKKGKIQGIDFSAREAIEQIYAFVENHTPEAKRKREEAAQAKQREAEEQRRRLAEITAKQREWEEERKRREEEQRERDAEFERRRRELEEKQAEERRAFEEAQRKRAEEQQRYFDEQRRKNEALEAKLASGRGGVSKVQSYLTRANKELGYSDFESAKKYFDDAVNEDTENADGWFGLMLCDFRVTDESELLKDLNPYLLRNILDSKNYKEAVKLCGNNERISNFKRRLSDTSLLLTRAGDMISRSDFKNAVEFYKLVNEFEPENAEGWFGQMLCGLKAENENKLLAIMKPDLLRKILASQNYKNAVKYGAKDARVMQFMHHLEDTDELMARATESHSKEKYPEASEYYAMAVNSSPENADAWFGLMLCQFSSQNEQVLSQKMTPALLKEITASQNYVSAVKFGKENKRIMKFVHRFTDAEELISLAGVELARENYGDATGYFGMAAAGAPKNADVWFGLLLCEFGVTDSVQLLEELSLKLYENIISSENYKKALKYGGDSGLICEFAHELNDVDRLIKRACTELQSGKYKAASKCFEVVMSKDADNVDGEFGLLLCSFKCANESVLLEKFDLSLLHNLNVSQHFKKIMSLRSKNPRADEFAKRLEKLSADAVIKTDGRITAKNETRDGLKAQIEKTRSSINACNGEISNVRTALNNLGREPKNMSRSLDLDYYMFLGLCILLAVVLALAFTFFYLYVWYGDDFRAWANFWSLLPESGFKNFFLYSITPYDPENLVSHIFDFSNFGMTLLTILKVALILVFGIIFLIVFTILFSIDLLIICFGLILPLVHLIYKIVYKNGSKKYQDWETKYDKLKSKLAGYESQLNKYISSIEKCQKEINSLNKEISKLHNESSEYGSFMKAYKV